MMLNLLKMNVMGLDDLSVVLMDKICMDVLIINSKR